MSDKIFDNNLGDFLSPILKVYSQQLNALGMDDSPQLNEFESGYFNEIFKDERGAFRFDKAKAIFVTGNAGGRVVSKKEYFSRLVKPWLIKNDTPQTFYKILSDKEQIESGGYDVIILSWVKIFSNRKQKKIIKIIGKKNDRR